MADDEMPTVYTKRRPMPKKTAKNTQIVHTFVLSPLNKFAAITQAKTIV